MAKDLEPESNRVVPVKKVNKKKKKSKKSMSGVMTEEAKERLEEKRERQQEAKNARLEAKSKLDQFICPLCSVLVEDWVVHHKGALHKDSRQRLKPPHVQKLYLKKEKELEKQQRRKMAKKLAKEAKEPTVSKAVAKELGLAEPAAAAAEASMGKKAAKPVPEVPVAAEKATKADPEKPADNDPWRSNRRVHEGKLQTRCNVCDRWINQMNLRSHNAGDGHKRKLASLPAEDRSSFFVARLNDKKRKLDHMTERAKAVTEPKANFKTFQSWAAGISEGKRV